MSLDTGPALIAQQRGGPTPDQWVREARELLAHVQLQDSDALLDPHWTPGEGNLNWRALFAALAELPQQPGLSSKFATKPQTSSGGRRT